MATKEKGRQWDGVSRPSNKAYDEGYDRIFNRKNISLFYILNKLVMAEVIW